MLVRLQVRGRGNYLVVIKDTDIDVNTLTIDVQSYFKRYTYVERESPFFWDNLLYVLPVNRMNAPARPNDNDRQGNLNEAEWVAIDNNGQGNMNDIEMVAIVGNGEGNMNEGETVV